MGPGGHSASAPPRPPAAPPAPGPARGPGLLPPSPPAVNNRRRQHKFRPPTRKLIGSRGPRGSDGKRIHRAVGGSGAGTGRSRPGRGAWAAGAAGGCGGQAAAGATEEGKAGREGAGPGRPPSPRSRGGPKRGGAAPAPRGFSGSAPRGPLPGGFWARPGNFGGVSRPGGAGQEMLGRGAASRPSPSGRAEPGQRCGACDAPGLPPPWAGWRGRESRREPPFASSRRVLREAGRVGGAWRSLREASASDRQLLEWGRAVSTWVWSESVRGSVF